MALSTQSPSKHNKFLGSNGSVSKKIPHPKSTGFYDETDVLLPSRTVSDEHTNGDKMFQTPTPKRRKINVDKRGELKSPGTLQTFLNESPVKQDTASAQKRRLRNEEVLDSQDENVDNDGVAVVQESRKTQLEESLPFVQADEEAIEAYEAHRAAEHADIVQEGDIDEDTPESRMEKRSWKRGRSSIYLDAFFLALSTVLQEEAHLFDDAEKAVFESFRNLSYEAQFLYVRLFLRKTSVWFRVGKLGYHQDIADIDGAVSELLVMRELPEGDPPPAKFPGEPEIPEEAVPLGRSFAFAESSDDLITTLDEASSLLLLDELKTIAKDAKVRGKNKTELLRNFRRTSGKQRGLGFLKRSETEDSITSERSTPAPEIDDDSATESEAGALSERSNTPVHDHNRDAHFTKKILERTGKCVRLSLVPLKLFERVHLVFYRSIEWTEKSLTTLILAKIARRNFPEYIVSRSANIFESRSILLEFESSLRLQFKVDYILEFSGYTTVKDLEEVRMMFERVYPRGQALLKIERSKEDRIYESGEGPYLRRFSPAWVYTRMMHKVLPILGRFKEHLREHSLICELLDQRLFHPSRRGAWYQRKALLEEHYMHAIMDSEGRSEEVNKKHWKRVALKTCETGLQDRECHIRYHYDLQKRIKKLEKQLKIPKREQHDFGHVGLLKPYERTIKGIQIVRDDDRPSLRRKSSNPDAKQPGLFREQSLNNNDSTTADNKDTPTTPAPIPEGPRRSTKTIWLDELDTSLPVSVESLTLSHYRKLHGYKGYHTEGGILRTLFGLLFYDILFAYVPNVFQTAYQTCPLDLHTDAFYSTRISEINARVNELSNGDAECILRSVWNDHAERKTCIVGVRWDYEFTDLLEIVNCWDGAALGTVMRVLAQEYAERGGGVPDLFMWKVFDHDADNVSNEDRDNAISSNTHNLRAGKNQYGTIKFVEVKSENDRLSDTQRLWISVLMNAGVDVELCHVLAREVRRTDGSVIWTTEEPSNDRAIDTEKNAIPKIEEDYTDASLVALERVSDECVTIGHADQ